MGSTPLRVRIRWSVFRSVQHGVSGWMVRGRGAQFYERLWFPTERDALDMKAALDASPTLDAAFATLHARATRNEGPTR